MKEKKEIDHFILRYKSALEQGFTLPQSYFEGKTAFSEIPFLSTDNSHFHVPANYFEELPARVMQKTAPLDTTKTQEGFALPDDYFNGLTVAVQNKIQKKERSILSRIEDYLPKPAYSLALAGICLLLLTGTWFLRNAGHPGVVNAPVEIAQLSDQAIGSYLSEEDILNELEESETGETKKSDVEEFVLQNVDESTLTETL